MKTIIKIFIISLIILLNYTSFSQPSNSQINNNKFKIEENNILYDSNIVIIKLPKIINTNYSEYGFNFSSQNNLGYFTKDSTSIFNGLFIEDIYSVELQDSQWINITKLNKKINTRLNDVCINFTHTGDSMFIYRDIRKGNIYVSEWNNKNNKWKRPKPFSAVNSKYAETSITMTANGRTVYFVRQTDLITGKDIYYCQKINNKWTKPTKLSDKINTKYDEESVFISADGNTLYFSSKGHNTIGGYDIFITTKDTSDNWTAPINIGKPINTPFDDLFYKQYENVAYYTSQIEGKKDLDIFQVNRINKQKDIIYVDNLIFDYNAETILNSSYPNLDSLANYLNNNKTARISIYGYSDNTGYDSHNLLLSEQRAVAVKNYLITKKVSENQINEVKGFGKAQPIADNSTIEGRGYNRRVEFEIIKQGKNQELKIIPIKVPEDLKIEIH